MKGYKLQLDLNMINMLKSLIGNRTNCAGIYFKHSNFLIPTSLKPDGFNLLYFKLGLFNLGEFKG